VIINALCRGVEVCLIKIKETVMREMAFEDMENIAGGLRLECGVAIAGLGIGILAYSAALPIGGLTLLFAMGSLSTTVYSWMVSCFSPH
jgi:hypothetical protein